MNPGRIAVAPFSAKILVGYHRPFRLVKSASVVPIHLGRAVATERSKDGVISPEELQWLRDNMIGDDTGDNISRLNRYFNEMTGVYWAWKNPGMLGNPAYVGLMHYRRLLALPGRKDCGTFLEALGLDEESLRRNLDGVDMITPHFYELKDNRTLYGQFLECSGEGHDIRHLDLALEILKDRSPEMYPEVLEIIHGPSGGSFFNMFIMERGLFDAYCEWIFGILMEMSGRLDLHSGDAREKRGLAFVAERMTSIFIRLASRKYRCRTVPVYTFDEKQYSAAQCLRYRVMSQITWGKARSRYLDKSSCCRAAKFDR